MYTSGQAGRHEPDGVYDWKKNLCEAESGLDLGIEGGGLRKKPSYYILFISGPSGDTWFLWFAPLISKKHL
jgi:hypothetical protein